MKGEDWSGLNLRAVLALGGGSSDWRGDLARLLRSDAPLDRSLRDKLADAVENETTHGARLDLKNHKGAQDQFEAGVSRHQWMEIGRWIASERAAGMSREATLDAAAELFRASHKKCEKAMAYHGKVESWTAEALESEAGQVMGRRHLEALYHSVTTRPDMKALNRDLLRKLPYRTELE